jgi:LmbE family N-acetylglucosaminyl deacetylase
MRERMIVSFVFAHPDDECFATGGTIAKLVKEGAYVDLLCATRGEAGSRGNPPLCTREELPGVREAELKEACRRLGIHQLTLFDYEDKTLAQANPVTLSLQIRAHLNKVRPDRVITFDPNGLSGHPDHKAIQQATWLAVQSDVQHPLRLYYVVIPEFRARMLNRPIHTIPDDQVAVTVDVSGYKKEVAHALRAHQTQHQSIQRVFPGVWEGTSVDSIPDEQYYQLAWESKEKTRTFWL